MDLSLDVRDGLPETLRVLLDAHPREGWAGHPEFGPLTRFWLERHAMFRQLLDLLRAEQAAREGGDLDPEAHAARLSRYGGLFLQELHAHHSIEDHHYFPKLVAAEPRLERAFALLDGDHHRLHDELDGLAEDANAVLRGGAPGPLTERLETMHRFLDRHLWDEEEVVVPVILEHGERRVG